MINSNIVTISDLFSGEKTNNKNLKALESSAAIKVLKKRIKKSGKKIGWSKVYKEILGKIRDLLDIPLDEILRSTWGSAREIREALEKSKLQASKTFIVSLTEHTIRSAHRPSIQVLFGQKKITEIEFDMNLSFEIEGVVLKIIAGSIRGIKSGSFKVSGSLEFNSISLLTLASKSIPIPGSLGRI